MTRLPYFVVLCVLPLVWSCRGTPDPVVRPPVFSLSFDRIEVSGPEELALCFVLKAENPHRAPAVLALAGCRFSLDGAETAGTLDFPAPAEDGTKPSLRLEPGSQKTFPLRFRIDSKTLIPEQSGDKAETMEALLALNLTASSEGKKISAAVKGRGEFPRIREPLFSIAAITIMQAELINTRFRVRIRVDNPNAFPVTLSSLTYELYGEGRFWAGRTEKTSVFVPPQAAAEKELFLTMNFIDMRRELLDQIIALEKVRYRFTGTVDVETGVEWFPVYTQNFNMEGESEVTR